MQSNMQSKPPVGVKRWLPIVFYALVIVFCGYIFMDLVQAHSDMGFKSNSLKDLTAAHANDPENTNIMYQLAHQLGKDGQNEQAFQLTKQMVAKEPKNLVYWQALARCAGESGHAVDALAAYKRATELDPHWTFGYMKQGEILAAAGMITEAMAEYDRAMQLDPTARGNLESWARCLLLKGRYQEAWELTQAETKKTMISDNCYKYMTEAALHTGKNLEETDKMLDYRMSATPLYPLGKYRALKIELVLVDKPDAATLAAMETVALTGVHELTTYPEDYAILGKIRRLRGDLKGAESALLTGAKIKNDENNDTTGCLEELMKVYKQMGRPDLEKQTRDRLWKITGDNADVVVRRAAVKKAPQDKTALLALAKALDAAGKFGEAAETYETVLAIDPQDPTAMAAREPARQKALEALEKVGIELVKPTPP